MLRSHVIAVLQSQGVSDAAPDKEIQKALLNAGWQKEHVDDGLAALHTPISEAIQNMSESETLIYTDKPLTNDMISRLLKIDVKTPVHHGERVREPLEGSEEGFDYTFLAIGIAIVSAFIIGSAYLS